MRTATRSRSELDLAKIDWRRADATTDEEIDRQPRQDPHTAPAFTAEAIIATRRRVAPDDVEDVRSLRIKLDLTQERFAARFGFSVGAIRQYESRRRIPIGPIRTLLRVIAREPDAVTRALANTPEMGANQRR
jgi:putative transcriptional regulator